MEADAKHVVQCDSCKMPLSLKKPKPEEPPNEAIKATLNLKNGETKDYHFCDETCLRDYLNSKHDRTKASVAKLELNMCTKEREIKS